MLHLILWILEVCCIDSIHHLEALVLVFYGYLLISNIVLKQLQKTYHTLFFYSSVPVVCHSDVPSPQSCQSLFGLVIKLQRCIIAWSSICWLWSTLSLSTLPQILQSTWLNQQQFQQILLSTWRNQRQFQQQTKIPLSNKIQNSCHHGWLAHYDLTRIRRIFYFRCRFYHLRAFHHIKQSLNVLMTWLKHLLMYCLVLG